MNNRPVDTSNAPDAAALLPVLGLFLLMPPVITLFVSQLEIAHTPLIVIYIFGVWLSLILCAALLARRLSTTATYRSAESAAAQADTPQRSA